MVVTCSELLLLLCIAVYSSACVYVMRWVCLCINWNIAPRSVQDRPRPAQGSRSQAVHQSRNSASFLQGPLRSFCIEPEGWRGARQATETRHHHSSAIFRLAAPIFPVVKGDGSVRICGDLYKLTVNKAAKLEVYPLPHIEDLLASLSKRKSFSKLDLSHTYPRCVWMNPPSSRSLWTHTEDFFATNDCYLGLPPLLPFSSISQRSFCKAC